MLLRLFTGEIDQAVAAGEASLAIARTHHLRERIAFALHDLTRAYLFSGRPQEGLRAGAEAETLWRQLDNKAMLVDNLISTTSARLFWQGPDEQLIPQLQEALALSQQIDNLWNQSYANHILGTLYHELGYISRAIAASKRSIELGIRAGFMVPVFINGSLLALLYGAVNRPALGFTWVEKALQEETGMLDHQAGPLAAKAYLCLRQGDLDRAHELIQESYAGLELQSLSAGTFFTFPTDGRLRLARKEFEQALAVGERFMDYLHQTQLQPYRADALYIQGQALLGLGRIEEGESTLDAARRQAEAHNARRILWEILVALADVAERHGNDDKARNLCDEAVASIAFIAQHIDDADLRASFLAQRAVRAVVPEI